MPTLREVRNRIGGVRKTQKITRAMKMVAAAKLRRAQAKVVAARPYAQKMWEVLEHLISQVHEEPVEMLRERQVSSAALVVITSDRGFCGAFNANLLKAAEGHIREYGDGVGVKLFCVGKKGNDYFRKRGYSVAGGRFGIFNSLGFLEAQGIAAEVVGGYREGKFDRVEIAYNQFKSLAQQQIEFEQFLPLPVEAAPDEHAPAPDYIYEPEWKELLLSLIPQYLNFLMWRILLESNCAEEGARMAAMENATENAREMIDALQLQYNKARQAAITKELLEVVSGAEALMAAE
jgi:F-type H+-transporting ATPase subunit gamma